MAPPVFPRPGFRWFPEFPKPPRPMHLFHACLLSPALVYDLRGRRILDALRVGVWMGLRGAGLGLLVVVPLFALGAYGAGDDTLLVTVGGTMGFDALPGALLTAGILGGILAMVYVWRRGSMIPGLLQGMDLAGAPAAWATGVKLL